MPFHRAWPQRAVYRIWPDFEVHPQIDASSTTIKAIAAQRSFDSFGEGIVWAVVDSGIDEKHAHFDGLPEPALIRRWQICTATSPEATRR